MDYIINRNGSFSIIGKSIKMANCYPSIDGRAIMPIDVKQYDNKIFYKLDCGTVEIKIEKNKNGIIVKPYVDIAEEIHDFSIIGASNLIGARKAYYLSFGMDDNSGWKEISETGKDSYGLISLYNEDSFLFAYANDFRKYTIKFNVVKIYTLFSKDYNLTCGYNFEGTNSKNINLPEIYFFEVEKLAKGLDICAKNIAKKMHARTPFEPAYHWCSWYYLYQNFSQRYLEEYLKGFRDSKENDFKYIQIDAGYFTSHGDWLNCNHRFPEGIEKAAKTIIDAGYKAGIWIGPFMVGDQSELYKNHKDWLIKDNCGKLITKIKSYSEPKTWGNVDGNYYVLDMTHPDAKEYMRGVFRTLKSYGFSLFKTDFMLWNMIDSSTVQRYDNTLTSVEIMRDTLQMIREEIGEDSYLLGCIAPFMPFVGYADGIRISGDMGANWEGDFGPAQMMKDICADNFMNNIFWQNDPDSIILRDFDTNFSDKETESLALLQAMSGGIVTTSEPVHRISKIRRELLDFVKPYGIRKAMIPKLGLDEKLIVLSHKLKEGFVILVMNPTDNIENRLLNYDELVGAKELYTYRWNLESNAFHSQKMECIYISLEGHESALFFLTSEKLQIKPKNLWKWNLD